jgi:lactate dehydrogenase-like 2-hydroxyacid dehydrogenase
VLCAGPGLPPVRFHDLRHLAGTLMSEAGVPPKRAQEILGHADVRTTLAIYTHTLKRKHDNSANRMADIAGLSSLGNKRETISSVADEETELSACSNGSVGWNRIDSQLIDCTDVIPKPLAAIPPGYLRMSALS